MPRNSRAKKQPESPAGEPVAITDTLETLKEEIPSLKIASELPRQLTPATTGPHADIPPPDQERIEPTPDTARPRSGPLNGQERELGQHTAAVMARRPAFAPVAEGFKNFVRLESAGIRVNKSIDYKTAALQFAEDRPLSRAIEYDHMEQVQRAGFQYKAKNRQWERPLPEGMAPGENLLAAERLAKEIAEARGVERGR